MKAYIALTPVRMSKPLVRATTVDTININNPSEREYCRRRTLHEVIRHLYVPVLCDQLTPDISRLSYVPNWLPLYAITRVHEDNTTKNGPRTKKRTLHGKQGKRQSD